MTTKKISREEKEEENQFEQECYIRALQSGDCVVVVLYAEVSTKAMKWYIKAARHICKKIILGPAFIFLLPDVDDRRHY